MLSPLIVFTGTVSVELVIDSSEKGVDAALLFDSKLVELHQEKGSADYQVGDVYIAKVRKVVPSLNAVFVDVGYDKDAFLHYLDLGPHFNTQSKFLADLYRGKHKDFDLQQVQMLPEIDKNGKIADQVSSGQILLIQIAKEPISSKGPRLTSEVTIAGRYIVLVPFSDKISVSQKIKSAEERERLRRLIGSIKPKNFGVIVRTVAENKKVAELDQDLRDLLLKWKNLLSAVPDAPLPKRVHGELDRTTSILRDMLNPDFTNIHVNDEQLAAELKAYVHEIAPDREHIIKLYKSRTGIFDHFGIHRQIKASFGRKVMLPSGAYLIIEHTEAMHVIDVNSGNRKAQGADQEQNALAVNMEAASEISRILRLRDMGGIIAVDFIDMASKDNNQTLYNRLKELMKTDRAKHTVLPPSKFGVVEITRQRVRPETDIDTNEACPVCSGTGQARASILVLDEIESQIRYLAGECSHKFLLMRTHPFIASHVTKGFFSSIKKQWSKSYKVKIDVQPDSSYHLLEFAFFSKEDDPIEV
jgi:ribonuclease G